MIEILLTSSIVQGQIELETNEQLPEIRDVILLSYSFSIDLNFSIVCFEDNSSRSRLERIIFECI